MTLEAHHRPHPSRTALHGLLYLPRSGDRVRFVGTGEQGEITSFMLEASMAVRGWLGASLMVQAAPSVETRDGLVMERRAGRTP